MIKYMMENRKQQSDVKAKPRKQAKAGADQQLGQTSIRAHLTGLSGAGSGQPLDPVRVKVEGFPYKDEEGSGASEVDRPICQPREPDQHSEEDSIRGYQGSNKEA